MGRDLHPRLLAEQHQRFGQGLRGDVEALLLRLLRSRFLRVRAHQEY